MRSGYRTPCTSFSEDTYRVYRYSVLIIAHPSDFFKSFFPENDRNREDIYELFRLFPRRHGPARLVRHPAFRSCLFINHLLLSRRYKSPPAAGGPSYGRGGAYSVPTVLGNSRVSRMLPTPVMYMTMRSKPRPKPACGTEPNLRVSRYCSYASSGILRAVIAAASLS